MTIYTADYHRNNTNCNNNTWCAVEQLSFSNKVNCLCVNSLSIQLFILQTNCIEALQDILCNYKCCKHGYNDTKSQCLSKALYCTRTDKIQNTCCDQCSNISIDDCGKCLSKSCINCCTNTLSSSDLLTDTCENNTVCIYSHTNTKNNTGNTWKCQCNFLVKRT